MTSSFHLWGDLLDVMQAEVVARLDPWSHQALAFTNKASLETWGQGDCWTQILSFFFSQCLAWKGPESYIAKKWKYEAPLPMLIGLAMRGDVPLLLDYVSRNGQRYPDDMVDTDLILWEALVRASNPKVLMYFTRERPDLLPPPSTPANFTLSLFLEGNGVTSRNPDAMPVLRNFAGTHSARWNAVLLEMAIDRVDIPFLSELKDVDMPLAEYMSDPNNVSIFFANEIHYWSFSRRADRIFRVLKSFVELDFHYNLMEEFGDEIRRKVDERLRSVYDDNLDPSEEFLLFYYEHFGKTTPQ
jgi:hypothetical protein